MAWAERGGRCAQSTSASRSAPTSRPASSSSVASSRRGFLPEIRTGCPSRRTSSGPSTWKVTVIRISSSTEA
ncbi:hypothetical protein [Nonomuraea salmonea]|uniref:hypothetical protein n=1 Tax=Nonomuraea salmonea TaxID=46181 RepID=UPI0031EE046B